MLSFPSIHPSRCSTSQAAATSLHLTWGRCCSVWGRTSRRMRVSHWLETPWFIRNVLDVWARSHRNMRTKTWFFLPKCSFFDHYAGSLFGSFLHSWFFCVQATSRTHWLTNLIFERTSMTALWSEGYNIRHKGILLLHNLRKLKS